MKFRLLVLIIVVILAALVGGFDDEYDLVSSKRDVSDEDAVLFSYAKFSSSKLVESSDSFRILCTLTSA